MSQPGTAASEVTLTKSNRGAITNAGPVVVFLLIQRGMELLTLLVILGLSLALALAGARSMLVLTFALMVRSIGRRPTSGSAPPAVRA